jgi:RimJ/RimL family protein N-acetyltransferase
VRLERVSDVATRDALLAGDLGDRTAAPGWPHEDTAPGLSFLDSGGLAFLVIDDDDRIAGECGIKVPPTDDGMVEIGYGLAAPSRGHGLGGAAVAALVAWLAEQPEVRAVEAEVHVGNVASSRLLERLGFIPVDTVVNEFRRYRFDLPR